MNTVALIAAAGWPTPDATAASINDSNWLERREKSRQRHNNGNGFGLTLGQAVQVAGWGTPQARDWKDSGNLSIIPVNGYLPRQAWQAAQAHGTNTNGSGAMTPKLPAADIFGVLNPQFSCWLMGFPQEWLSCADSAMP